MSSSDSPERTRAGRSWHGWTDCFAERGERSSLFVGSLTVMRARRPFWNLLLLVLLAPLLTSSSMHPDGAPVVEAPVGSNLYVDGKVGRDGNTGRSPTDAFKTIARAASSLPAGEAAAGWTLRVKGYRNYVYRERPIPPGWDRRGTATARLRFEAWGYVPGKDDYVKPIVSGADVAPSAGQEWRRTEVKGVWATHWASKPFGFGQYPGSLRAILFQDNTTWIWEQSSLAALRARAEGGKGGFWYDSGTRQLFVSTVGSGEPRRHLIEVVMRNAFIFFGSYGVQYVDVRGFEVRHAANGIAFVKGADYGIVADNVVMGNLMMGIQTSGGQTPMGPDPAVGNVVRRNVGSYNTIQMIKIDEGSVESSYCGNDSSHNGLQGIKVQGPPGGTGYTGTTRDIVICDNRLHDNSFNPTRNPYNNASGLTISNGAQRVFVRSNELYRNDVGIHVTQENAGIQKMEGILLSGNGVHHNRRFGLNLYDGAHSAEGGNGSLRSEHDSYWRNGVGVMAARGTTNKHIVDCAVFNNNGDGLKIGEPGKAKAALVVTGAVITHNNGYGANLVAGNRLDLRSSILSGNHRGVTRGPVTLE